LERDDLVDALAAATVPRRRAVAPAPGQKTRYDDEGRARRTPQRLREPFVDPRAGERGSDPALDFAEMAALAGKEGGRIGGGDEGAHLVQPGADRRVTPAAIELRGAGQIDLRQQRPSVEEHGQSHGRVVAEAVARAQ